MLENNQKIPEGWSVKKLGLCLSLLKDGTHGTHIDVPNGIMLLSAKDVINGQIILSKDSRRISIGDFNLLHKKYHIQNGDVVLTIVGTIGRCAIIDNYNDNYTFQRSVAILRPYKEITSKYLLTYIQGSSFQKELLKRQSVSAQPGVYLDDLSKIYLLLPPLPEQEKIAEILGTWDEAIEKLSNLIEQKKLLKKALMQKLFLDLKNVSFKRFDEVFTDYSDKNHSDYPLLSATQDLGVIPRTMLDGRVMSPEGSLAGYKLVQKGDFVISLRSFQGGLEYSSYYGIISPAYTVLKPKMNISRQFYKYFFKSYEFVNKYLSIAVIGIRDGKQISYPDLKSVKIPYPNLFNQQAIADVLTKADEEIDLLNKKLILFKEQKKGLMQQLLTGQIRVKVN